MISKEIDEYARAHTEAENPLLQHINRETYAQVLHPRMLSGHLQGKILSLLSRLLKPHRILEIGTFTGYSALCLAEGLSPEGILFTIDKDEEVLTRARGYIEQSKFAAQIRILCGNAMELVPGLDEIFDLVYIDADKANYPNYFDLIVDRVRSGGLIIADNVLWSGKVVDSEELIKKDKNTEAISSFNEKVHQDDRVSNLLLPVRDGLMIMQKK